MPQTRPNIAMNTPRGHQTIVIIMLLYFNTPRGQQEINIRAAAAAQPASGRRPSILMLPNVFLRTDGENKTDFSPKRSCRLRETTRTRRGRGGYQTRGKLQVPTTKQPAGNKRKNTPGARQAYGKPLPGTQTRFQPRVTPLGENY